MANKGTLSRRSFIKISAAAAGGLLISFGIPTLTKAEEKNIVLNHHLSINSSGIATISFLRSEMGQGIKTALPMLIAEELEMDWKNVQVTQPPYDIRFGQQATVASRSIHDEWEALRQVGASVRELLILAAANRWQVHPESCYAERGVVYHSQSSKSLSYGQLVEEAARLEMPENVALKKPADFKLIGKSIPRIDIPEKVMGRAVFGIDVNVPEMAIATVLRCPVFGGKVKRFDATKTKKLTGIIDVVEITGGIAVIGENYWAAKRGKDMLDVQWNAKGLEDINSESIFIGQREALVKPGDHIVTDEGNFTSAYNKAEWQLSADYEAPFQAHATMEPMNCTADVKEGACRIWAPTQGTLWIQMTISEALEIPMKNIEIHTTYMGCGFGRRAETDFVLDAVEASKAVGRPVKVIWSREDDMQHDFYRPAFSMQLKAGIDKNGKPVAWKHQLAGPSVVRRWDVSAFDWAAITGSDWLPYSIPNFRTEATFIPTNVPVGYWRGTANSYTQFANETFIDEIATRQQIDPLEYRLGLLEDAPRARKVLESVAVQTQWGSSLPAGVGRGVALFAQEWDEFKVYCAQVADIELSETGDIRVRRIFCSIDCGQIVHPDTVIAQTEGSIVFGLAAALYGEIEIEKGRVKQSNFHDYPMPKYNEVPEIEVRLIKTTEFPAGAGEKAVGATAPAIANAVYNLTGQRLRRLPLRLDNTTIS
ncbi:MAG: molybdopterin cofactor-binding domain-containing protein [Calditrichia bacterium]